ncbi:MAG: 2-C-methyl-D-erythritol 4-phosphate cytidylyltransferase [Victivallales bacterium]|nr:2-C-methyl-D-erythritol 4-phosphate cytidylyltransferase [Victivallales bacterium]
MPSSTPNPDTGLVIAAGGFAMRFGSNKLFAELALRPVFLHSLARLAPYVAQTVLVVPVTAHNEFVQHLQMAGLTNVTIVDGGPIRQASVLAGVKALRPEITLVAIQDAARPLTPVDLLQRCLESARQFGSGIAAHQVTDTIKVVSAEGIILSTPDRNTLWAAETPQCFRKDWLLEAYETCQQQNIVVTDDAQAVQLLGHSTRIVPSQTPNLKITYQDDLKLANALLANEPFA